MTRAAGAVALPRLPAGLPGGRQASFDLLVALLALAGLLVAMGVVLIAARAKRRWAERRAASLAGPYRRLVLAVVASEGPDPSALDSLATLPSRTWDALEPTIVSLLGQVRGEARAGLVEVLRRRGTAARAVRRLGHPGAVGRCRAAEVLGQLGETAAVPALVVALGDRRPEVRQVAARSLGRIGDPSAAPALVSALGPNRPVPRPAVVRSLVRLGTGAVPVLTGALGSEQPGVREVAVEVLGLIGDPVVAPALARLVTSSEDPELTCQALRALGRIGAPAALRPLVTSLASSSSADVRVAAALALGELETREAAPVLGEALRDPDHRVAHAAAEALTRIGPAGWSVLEQAGEDATCPLAAAHAREVLAIAKLGLAPGRRLSPDGTSISEPPADDYVAVGPADPD